MGKTWGELKSEIVNLGFEKQTAADKMAGIFIEAVNRAEMMIVTQVRPLKKFITVTVNEPSTVDMLTAASDFVRFLPPVKVAGENKTAKSRILTNSKVKFSEAGSYDIFYAAEPEKITADTADDFEIGLDADLAAMVAPLAAYFVWLDDDERKAAMYYNVYQDMAAAVMQAEANTVRISARVMA